MLVRNSFRGSALGFLVGDEIPEVQGNRCEESGNQAKPSESCREVVRDFDPGPGIEEISDVIVRKIGLPEGFLYLPMPVRARTVTETIPWGEDQPTGEGKQDAE